MFGGEDKKYLLQLYKALHPDDERTDEDDLELVTIENVLTTIYIMTLALLQMESL